VIPDLFTRYIRDLQLIKNHFFNLLSKYYFNLYYFNQKLNNYCKHYCLVEAGNDSDKIKSVLNSLPETHYHALKRIIEHLIKYILFNEIMNQTFNYWVFRITKFHVNNGLDNKNLATLWALTIFENSVDPKLSLTNNHSISSKKIGFVSKMLTNYDKWFRNDLKEEEGPNNITV
jgi:hypothetical protein